MNKTEIGRGIDDINCSFNWPLFQNSYTQIGQLNPYQVTHGLSAAELLSCTIAPSQESYSYLSQDIFHQRGRI